MTRTILRTIETDASEGRRRAIGGAAAILALALVAALHPRTAAATGSAVDATDSGVMAGTAADTVAALVPPDSLAALARALDRRPNDLAAGNAYRLAARTLGRTGDALAFLDSLAATHPDASSLAVHWALAQLDQIGTAGLDLRSGAIAASRAIGRLNQVIDRRPDYWPALYARALCNLLWPADARRARVAATDFELCLFNLEADPDRPSPFLVHLGLGDALVKQRQYGNARLHYELVAPLARDRTPVSRRLACDSNALLELIERLHGFDRAPDTDLSPFWTARARPASGADR